MEQKSSCSFMLSPEEIEMLAYWLIEAGYEAGCGNARSTETARYSHWGSGSIVVFYQSGSVLVQGKEQAQTVESINKSFQPVAEY